MTIEYRGLKLDPFQEKAIQLIDECKSLVVAAPTGAGKTLIAEYAIDKSLKEGWRIIYTAPIKAISNQKFRDFTRAYGEKVGILTGDVSLNPYAQALIMTTEIFRNTIFDDPDRLRDVRYVIFDEVHFMDDEERGTVWEESIIFAPPHVRFICLSATISNLHKFAAWVSHVREDKLEIVEETERPVPLKHLLFIQGKGIGNIKDLMKLEQSVPKARFGRWENPREPEPEDEQPGGLPARKILNWRRALIDHLQETSRLPCLFFCFSRRDCELHAYENMSRNLLTEAESAEINRLLNELCRRYDVADDPAVREIAKMLRRGVVCHHAGLLPTQKEIIERLFTTGLIKILFATETFAMGVNMPAKTVVFDSLHKFNGVERAYLKSRQYQQMAGRAGRRGMDEVGYVYSHVEWPFVRAGAVERIIYGRPEDISSQFNLSYSTVLNLYSRLGTGIFKACQKSFAAFLVEQKEKNRRRQPQPGGVRFNGMLDQLHRRIALLDNIGFIKGGKPTERGVFAGRIYGYELQIAILFFDGIFQRLSADEINGLLCAIVHESRRSERMGRRRFRNRGFPGPFNRARWAVERLRNREKAQGISVLTKELDFGLSEAAMAWSEGCDFIELGRFTEAADGDIVRTFRLTIQLARQLARALDGHQDLRSRLDAAVRGMNRDIVDAERLLRMG